MPSIDQIIQDEIARNAKCEIRAAVAEWLKQEASDAVVSQVKTAIQPFLVMMNDQRKVIEALKAQLEVASQPLAKTVHRQAKPEPQLESILFPGKMDATSRLETPVAAPVALPQGRRRGRPCKIDPVAAATEPRPDGWCFRNEPRLSKERIIRVREKLGITQLQLAALLGVDAFAIQNWEAGKTAPTKDQKRQIAFIRDLNLSKRRKLFIAKNILRKGGAK